MSDCPMYIFLDSEGEPVQELSAVCVNTQTLQIISAFHGHAMCPMPDKDYFSRRFIHGLDVNYLLSHGSPSPRDLCTDLCRWLDQLPPWCEFHFFANNPTMEKKLFPYLIINDINLPRWVERVNSKAHIMAKAAKDNSTPVLDHNCPRAAHASYISSSSPFRRPQCSLTPSQLAKLSSGYHCSLYDVLECYFTYCHRALG